VLCDVPDDVADKGRAAGTCDHEQAGNARDSESEVALRSGLPCIAQETTASSLYLRMPQRARDRVVPGREHNDVEAMLAVACPRPPRTYLPNRCEPEVDERDVLAVIGFVVVGSSAQAFGSDRMVTGTERMRRSGIVDRLPDLAPNELG
jgi:hypothetical protein